MLKIIVTIKGYSLTQIVKVENNSNNSQLTKLKIIVN